MRESGLQGIVEHAFPTVREWNWERSERAFDCDLAHCPAGMGGLWIKSVFGPLFCHHYSQTWFLPPSSSWVCLILVTLLVSVVFPDRFLWGLFVRHTFADPTTPVQCLPYNRHHMNIYYLSEFFIKYADLNQMSLCMIKWCVCISNTNASSHISIFQDLYFFINFYRNVVNLQCCVHSALQKSECIFFFKKFSYFMVTTHFHFSVTHP